MKKVTENRQSKSRAGVVGGGVEADGQQLIYGKLIEALER